MKNILVATDGSTTASRAVAEAVQLAGQAGAEVTFLNVVEPGHVNREYRQMAEVELNRRGTDQTAFLPLLNAFAGMNATQAIETIEGNSQAVAQLVSDRILDDAERVAQTAGLSGVKKVSALGDAATEIVKVAGSSHADLVVVGRRGFGEVAELLLGSVSQKVLHRLGTNVLVVS